MAISDSERRKYEDKLASLSWADGVPAPVDADGEVVPLATRVVYDKDDTELSVSSFDFKSDGYNNGWTVFCALGPNFMAQPYGSQELHLHRPDSWEKLLDDLDNAVKGGDNAECLYMRREDIEVGEQCSGCRLYNADDVFSDCSCLAYGDIADRIRKLRGED